MSEIKEIATYMYIFDRAVRNSALTSKLSDEFCLFFIDMTYVPGQFIRYIFLAPSHKQPFFKMAA